MVFYDCFSIRKLLQGQYNWGFRSPPLPGRIFDIFHPADGIHLFRLQAQITEVNVSPQQMDPADLSVPGIYDRERSPATEPGEVLLSISSAAPAQIPSSSLSSRSADSRYPIPAGICPAEEIS